MSKGKWILILFLIGILGFSYWIFRSGKKNGAVQYKFEKVERGEVTSTVTATGSLSALTTVSVGSQVSGIIAHLYADFNSIVRRGQLLAELDPTTFQAQVDQRKADLERARVEEENARIAFERSKKLFQNELLSESEYDSASAALHSSQASVKQAEAAMRQAVTNLSYTRIVSPIDGVVVDRQYDIGQTVAASFQAPTLFTIAQDLTRMQVATNIDEADIGRVQSGSEAQFTVDAFPDRVFKGAISQIRLSPQIVQNVVTYPVLIDVKNDDLSLKPGMTANVTIPIEVLPDVLKVPNSALRFKPSPSEVAETGRKPDAATIKRGSVVYMMQPGGKLKPVEVQTSITDGNFTAIVSDGLKVGDSIVTGLATARAMDSTGGMGAGSRRRPF